MPRDGSGVYTLPSGNPVITNTVITSTWANTTMGDIAAQLNNVFTRDGVVGPTGPFKIIDGTISAPGLTFIAETTTGLFRPVPNAMAVAISGMEITRWSDTGAKVAFADGAVATPSITFLDDQDTGFYSPAPGVVVLVSDGVEVMRWTPDGTVSNTLPPGTTLDYAGSVLPNGYLWCDGGAYSRTTYAKLYAALGGVASPWGQGDGSTTFNVPPSARRVVVGAGGAATAVLGNTVGALGGVETVALTAAEMPSHAHGVNDGTHAHGVNDPGHLHNWPNQGALTWGAEINNRGLSTAGAYNDQGPRTQTLAAATGISIAGAFANISIQAAGGSGAHNNVQPSMVMNRIIKY